MTLLVDLLAVAVILGWCATLSARGRTRATVDDPPETSIVDTSADRARATAAWAEGSRADWDRHVRPSIARELTELLRARRDPGAPDRHRVGERLFGEQLWALVDPARPFTSDLDRPGPGRDALARILDRLERL